MPLNDKIASVLLFSQEGSVCLRQQNGRKQVTPRRVFKLPGLSLSKGMACGSWDPGVNGALGWAGLAGRGLEACCLVPHLRDNPSREKSSVPAHAKQAHSDLGTWP